MIPAAITMRILTHLSVSATRSCLPLLAVVVLAGCASYPMGLNKAQWEALTPPQQAEYRARQYAIDEERARLHAAEEARRVQAQQEAEAQERARIAEAYRQARYGDIITVTVREGFLAFYGKHHPYEPVAFDLVRGETKSVVFRRQRQPHIATAILMHFSEDGNTFYFDFLSCQRLVAINDGWQRGREYEGLDVGGHDGHALGQGIRIGVKFKLLPLVKRSAASKPPHTPDGLLPNSSRK